MIVYCDKTKGGSKKLQEGVAGTLSCRINGECSQNVAILELELSQSRNYNVVPVQRVCHDCHDILHLFMLLFPERGVASHPSHRLAPLPLKPPLKTRTNDGLLDCK